MVATSDMLIRRASGFLITPDDGPRNNRRVIQIEDAPPARLLMRFTYVHPRFVSPSVCLSFFLREEEEEGRGRGTKSFCQNRESKPTTVRQPPRGNRYGCCFLLCNSPTVIAGKLENWKEIIGGEEGRMCASREINLEFLWIGI